MMCIKHNRWFRIGEGCPFCKEERKQLINRICADELESVKLECEIRELEDENERLMKKYGLS